MTRSMLATTALVSLSSAGCVDTVATMQSGQFAGTASVDKPEPNTSAATWQMPWQLSPMTAASEARGEEGILVYVPQTGYVRGTRTALASLGSPLQKASGPNRTVEACRSVVQSEATKIGARDVEAVSAGAHRRNSKGQYVAPVHMRITYARLGGYEVRDALLTCIVDAKGKIVDAFA